MHNSTEERRVRIKSFLYCLIFIMLEFKFRTFQYNVLFLWQNSVLEVLNKRRTYFEQIQKNYF